MSTASPSPPIYRARYRATNVVHYGESALSSSSDDDDEKDDDVGEKEDVPWRTRGREDEKRENKKQNTKKKKRTLQKKSAKEFETMLLQSAEKEGGRLGPSEREKMKRKREKEEKQKMLLK